MLQKSNIITLNKMLQKGNKNNYLYYICYKKVTYYVFPKIRWRDYE